MNSIKVILVDSNEHFLKILRNLLMEKFNVEIIGETSNIEEFEEFEKLSNYHLADIIFLDIMFPGVNGFDMTKKMLFKEPYLKIIALTMNPDKVDLTTLIFVGFKGCIFKASLFEEISDAFESVSQGFFYFPENIQLFPN